MSDPISLRKIPPEALRLAQELSAQTGLSINDVFRLALASGVLVEATKVAPRADGTFGGLSGAALAKALHRPLRSAIDLLIEHGEHPYKAAWSSEGREHHGNTSANRPRVPMAQEKNRTQNDGIEDDLDALGIGFSLTEALEDDQ